MTSAYLHAAAEDIAEVVRAMLRLAGGRITEKRDRAELHVVCARSCRDARAPETPAIRLLVARGSERERRAARATGFDDVIDPEPKNLVTRLRYWLERARCAAQIRVTDDGVEVDGVPLSLPPIQRTLMKTLDETYPARAPRGRLLELVWGVDPERKTTCVGTTVWNLNQKLAPFGVRIDGNRKGWLIPRSKS